MNFPSAFITLETFEKRFKVLKTFLIKSRLSQPLLYSPLPLQILSIHLNILISRYGQGKAPGYWQGDDNLKTREINEGNARIELSYWLSID